MRLTAAHYGSSSLTHIGDNGLRLQHGLGGRSMALGTNLTGINSFLGYYPFANIMWNGAPWEQNTGTGGFTQELGELVAVTPTDTFRSKLCEAYYESLPSGTYTVLNPDGCEIGIGAFGTQNLAAFTTATSFTFTYNNDQLLALHARGSVTNINGPIQIIMPGRLTAFNAGDYWNPEFLTFIGGLNLKCIRFMDWLNTYYNVSKNWVDEPTIDAITFRSKNSLLRSTVPYELCVDLCNRLNVNPWMCVPVRATNDYRDGAAAYLDANLNADLRVYLEHGNETWNFDTAFNDARVWTELYTHTRYEAVSYIGISGWTLAGHGLTNGEAVSVFFTPDNYTSSPDAQVYPLGYGETLYAEVIDANNFVLHSTNVAGTVRPSTALTPKLLYSKRVEAGKVASVDTNNGIASKEMWDRFDAILGRSRCIHVMGTQLVVPSSTTARLAPSGVTAATDFVAVAHYYQGDWWVSCVDVASGQLTPKAWSRYSGGSVRVAVYTNGSTPTMTEVLAGTGTGYIGHRDIAIASTDADVYTSASAITGLSNGTTYAIRAVLTGLGGYKWMASGTATVSASTSTVAIYDSDANMAKRARRDTVEYLSPFIASQQAASGSIPVIAYECGSDYFGGQVPLAEVIAWRSAWTQTADAGDVFGHFYTTMAAQGMKLMNQFSDVNATPGVFNMVEAFDDTTDPRYVKFAGYAGTVKAKRAFTIADITADNVVTEPSYPAVVETFADASLTYSIFNGDNGGNFAIVGNELRIVNGTGINWTVPTGRIITVEASNGDTTDYFNVSFSTGDAWYEADARFAWDSIADVDNAAINPIIGGNLALTGTAATIASGLWDTGEVGRYTSATASIATISANNPILLAAVLDKDNHSASFRFVVYCGSGQLFTLYNNGSNVLVGRWNTGVAIDQACAAANPTGKHVYWTYYDADPTTPKIHSGIDQVEFGTGTAANFAGVTFARDLTIGGPNSANSSNMKHGSTQIVNRSGMTLANALAIVQKMQTLHGI